MTLSFVSQELPFSLCNIVLLWLFVGCFSADAFVVNLSYLGTALFNFNSLMNWYLEALFCCFYSPIGGTIAQFFFSFYLSRLTVFESQHFSLSTTSPRGVTCTLFVAASASGVGGPLLLPALLWLLVLLQSLASPPENYREIY